MRRREAANAARWLARAISWHPPVSVDVNDDADEWKRTMGALLQILVKDEVTLVCEVPNGMHGLDPTLTSDCRHFRLVAGRFSRSIDAGCLFRADNLRSPIWCCPFESISSTRHNLRCQNEYLGWHSISICGW